MEGNGRIDVSKFTPTQLRLWEVLKDGAPHSCTELINVIDSQADINSLRIHMTFMRKKLRPQLYTLMTERVRMPDNKSPTHYRLVRLVTNALS